MDFFLNKVVLHHFWLVLYGIIGWWLILWSIAKSRHDNKNGRFVFKHWWRKYYDEFVVTLFVGLSFIIFDDEIKELIKDITDYDLEYQEYHYLLAAPVTDIFYKLVSIWKKNN